MYLPCALLKAVCSLTLVVVVGDVPLILLPLPPSLYFVFTAVRWVSCLVVL